MDHGSLLEGVTVDPKHVDESVEPHLWAFVDVPTGPTGVPATIEPPASLYSPALRHSYRLHHDFPSGVHSYRRDP